MGITNKNVIMLHKLKQRLEFKPLFENRQQRDGDFISNSELQIVRNKIISEDVINNRLGTVTSSLQFNMTSCPGQKLERDRDLADYMCYITGNSVGDIISSYYFQSNENRFHIL